jgi:hypothetical protein
MTNVIWNIFVSLAGLLLFFTGLTVAVNTPFVWQGWLSAASGVAIFLYGYFRDTVQHRAVELYAGIDPNEPYGDVPEGYTEPTFTGHRLPLGYRVPNGAYSVRGSGEQIAANPPYGSFSCYTSKDVCSVS